MLSTEIQRSVRLNKKKKSTNISPYPDEVIDRLARAFYPAILALLIVCGFLQGASGRAHPVFAFSPLIRDFQPHFSDTPLAHRSKLALHTPAGHCR